MSSDLTLECPAKINLSLRVLGRREDGFHRIATVLQTIQLSDRLTVRRISARAPIRIEVAGSADIPADESNLVLRAARAFLDATGSPARGLHFRLVKRIPAGSGLGGGSSDAAAALIALQRLWDEPLDRRQLVALAAALGSDVPFFLVRGTALATGRGERIRALDDAMEQTPLLLALPEVPVSTPAVYRAWRTTKDRGRPDRTRFRPTSLLPPPPARRNPASWVLGNDLETVARRLTPEVDRLLRAMEEDGGSEFEAGPQLSGSGGAVFAFGEGYGLERRLAGLKTRVLRTRLLRRG